MREDTLLGMQLDEYRLEAPLGKGGMGRVYRGRDVRLDRPVAVKVIEVSFRDDPDYIQRFQREAQSIARLDHPHVVSIYRYGEVDGVLYIAMQYIEGANLDFVLESYQRDKEFIENTDALRIVREAASALDYIHAQGIIHRDVKPANIMLAKEDARAILTDFGLALQIEVGTRGEIFGSPNYVAPEQAISSANAVAQSDLYSLGVIVYQMFTNQLPFKAKNPVDMAMMHMNRIPPLPRQLRPELSLDVETVILKMLEKRPQDRYQTGRTLYLALERACRSGSQRIVDSG
jgi:serine/threonine protein kinase